MCSVLTNAVTVGHVMLYMVDIAISMSLHNTAAVGADKHEYAAPNHILIDDRDKAILPWREAGGIGILHTSANDTIAQLKELGL